MVQFGHTPFYYRSNPESLNFSIYRDAMAAQNLISGKLSQLLLQGPPHSPLGQGCPAFEVGVAWQTWKRT